MIGPELSDLLKLLVSVAVTVLFVLVPVFLMFAVAAVVWRGMLRAASSAGGWRELAAAYPAKAAPGGQRLRWQWVKVGLADYRRSLTVTMAPDGVHLAIMRLYRLGHDPLSIPWSDIHAEPGGTYFFRKVIALKFGKAPTVTMYVRPGLFERMAEASGGRLHLAPAGTHAMRAASPRSI